jgi:hypothetical protein
VWIGDSGGIIRSTSVQGTLECPGTASATGPGTGNLFCACSQDSDCGPGAGCNSGNHLCFYTLPQPAGFSGFSPAKPWNWELPAMGDTARFCLSQPSTSSGRSLPVPVWWSGNVFARTGCQPDGTSCLTGNCTSNANSSCPAGVGGGQPASLAEFTLQSTATDFYDISVINGANIGMQFGPIAGSTTAAGSGQYWCKTPGQGCTYDFGQFARSVPLPSAGHPTDYTAALALTEAPCTVGTGNPAAGQPPAGCPVFVDPQGVSYSCSGGSHNGVCHKTCSSDSQCPGGLHCLEAGDGKSYCQCSAHSDCAAGQSCGTQLVPGLGASGAFSPQVYLQQCGHFEGWWTADTLCGNVNNIVGSPGQPILNCRAGLVDGDGSTTNIASLLECATFSSSAPGGVAGITPTQAPATAPELRRDVAAARQIH